MNIKILMGMSSYFLSTLPISSSNKWYVTEWNRKLKSKPIVGVEVDWLQGKSSKASKTDAKKQHPEYKSTLRQTSKDNWYKITELLD